MSVLKASPLMCRMFIFNPSYGQREGDEHDKLMFYHPPDVPLDTKCQQIGFAEAAISFSEQFVEQGSISSCEQANQVDNPPFYQLSTTRELSVFVIVESGFVLGMAVDKKACAEAKYATCAQVIAQILLTSYSRFRLFFGTFVGILKESETHDVDSLRSRLQFFFPRYLNSLKFSGMPLLDLLNGVRHLKLDAVTVLQVETLMAHVIREMGNIEHMICVYNEQLVWYNMPKQDLPHIFWVYILRYLDQHILPACIRTEANPENSAQNATSCGKFVTYPTDFSVEQVDVTKLTTVFIHNENISSCNLLVEPTDADSEGEGASKRKLSQGLFSAKGFNDTKLQKYRLVVYRALNTCVAMFVPTETDDLQECCSNIQWYRRLDALLGPSLTKIDANIGDVYSMANGFLSDVHFVYYNAHNLSLFSSMQSSHIKNGSQPSMRPPPNDVILLSCHIRDEVRRSEFSGDAIARSTDGEWWVVSKLSNNRELHLILPYKNASLNDIHEYVKKICNTHFQHIFTIE